ncbi:MAG: ABC transporter ATP-binding protein [Bacteroidota bacterium]
MLEVKNIHKSYSGKEALSGVSLTVPEGCIFGLLGPNGAGKTTLIRIITQIINEDQGEILLKDKPMTPADVRRIGYLPEERGLYKKMKVGEQLLFLAGLKGLSKPQAKQQIKYWFEKLGVEGWWNKKVEDLSKGMSQKVQFIATVLHQPDLVILDEPFSGFDPVNANLIKDNILEMREQGTTVIFSTHRMESVEELCDHVAMINNSQKILDGAKEEIKSEYRSNTFMIEHTKTIQDLPLDFSLISSVNGRGEMYTSQIQINNRQSPNDLLKVLIPMIEITSFSEKIPSMNDIFIMKVGGGSDE